MLPSSMAIPDPASRLKKLLEKLPKAQQLQLLEFAEFLIQRYPVEKSPDGPSELVDIPRPSKETVIAAMKRLRESYPMLDQQILLKETSELMSSHMLAGEPAEKVIDKLEQVFKKCYEALQSDS